MKPLPDDITIKDAMKIIKEHIKDKNTDELQKVEFFKNLFFFFSVK